MQQSVHNAKLVIAGAGQEETNLRRLTAEMKLEDVASLVGYVTEDDKEALLARCDVFVLPSKGEAFGIAILEAMAYQKTVITSNSGAFLEILRDGDTGLIFPVGAVGDLASAIIRVHADNALRTAMGKNARADLERRFDIKKIADDYAAIYTELVNNT